MLPLKIMPAQKKIPEPKLEAESEFPNSNPGKNQKQPVDDEERKLRFKSKSQTESYPKL